MSWQMWVRYVRFGFSSATIQAQDLSPEQSSTLFWINVAASVVIASLLIVLAPAIAAFYGDARVGHITAASAALVLLGSLSLQHTALLTRDMRYRQIATIIVSSAIAESSATIMFAVYQAS